jgi:hypothetical protein
MIDNLTVQPLPSIFVGKEIINQRVKLYMQHKHPLLSAGLSKNGVQREETKSIWYSKDHLQTLLNEITLAKGDGMRIYFGAYGNEEGRPEGQLCLLMVLTRPGTVSGSHKDIILEKEPDFEERKGAFKKRSLGLDMETEDELPKEYNYGAPCPPICITDDGEFPQ